MKTKEPTSKQRETRESWKNRAPTEPPGNGEATFGPEFELRSWIYLPLGIVYSVVILLIVSRVHLIPYLLLLLLVSFLFKKTAQKIFFHVPTDWVRDVDYRRMAAKVEETCRARGDCRVEEFPDKKGRLVSKVTYENGEWWAIVKDNTVVEVISLDGSLADWRRREGRWQHDIFELAGAVGITPARFFNWPNGGHVNIGLKSAFKGNVLLLRNFLVDFTQHSEIAHGILLNDQRSAPSVAASPRKRRGLVEALRIVDSMPNLTVEGFIDVINARVYAGEVYHQALSMKTAGNGRDRLEAEDDQVVELRSVRAQRNIREFRLLAELFSARIEYLEKAFKGPIPYRGLGPAKVNGGKIFK